MGSVRFGGMPRGYSTMQVNQFFVGGEIGKEADALARLLAHKLSTKKHMNYQPFVLDKINMLADDTTSGWAA